MKSVVIITDDTCDMPLELIEKHNISLISIKIIFSDKAYRSCGVKGDLSIDEYYQRVEKEIPTTSTASPGIITECLNSAFEQAEAVIGIFLSNNLSPVASNTQALVNQSYPDKKIKIYDSSVTSVGLAALVLEAAILASQGATFDEICSKVDTWVEQTNFAGIMFTLENLVRTGRVPKTKKFLADFFKVKPVVEMVDGQIDVQGKIRADDKIIIDQMKNLGRNALEHMSNGVNSLIIGHTRWLDASKQITEYLKDHNPYNKQIIVQETSPIVANFVGKKTLTMGYIGEFNINWLLKK